MRFSRRRAVSPIIATLLLIAITVAAGIIVYVYVNSLSGNLTGSSGNQVSTQLQLQADSFNSFKVSGTTYGSGQVLDLFLTNAGSSSLTISNVYVDGTQLTEWATLTGPPVAYEPDLTVPTTQTAGGCFAAVSPSATLSFAVSGTPSASGTSSSCTGTGTGACSSTAFCILPNSVTETGLATSTTPGLAAQASVQLVIGLNGGPCGSSYLPPSCPATVGTSHIVKIVTTTGGVAVITVTAGRSG